MKITDVKVIGCTFPVSEFGKGRRMYSAVLVRTFTDEGIEGIGQVTATPYEVACAIVDRLIRPTLIGRDPFDIERIVFDIYNFLHRRTYGYSLHVLGAIEMSLWDIMGKKLKLPVYKILGGKFRERVKVYASPSWKCSGPAEDFAKHILTCYENGFDVVKIRLGFGFEHAVRTMKIIRDYVGYDIKLPVDLNCGYGPSTAVKLINALERYEPLWIEEPIPATNIERYIELRKKVNVPIAAGEGHTPEEMVALITRGGIDIIQPDITHHGGFVKVKKICSIAEAYQVPVVLHAWSTQLVTAASLHLALSTPNVLMVEFEVRDEREFIKEPLIVEGGYIKALEKPGLGIEIRDEVFEKYVYEEYPDFYKEDFLVKPIHGGEIPEDDYLNFYFKSS